MNTLIRNTLGLLLIVGTIAGTASVTLARAPIDWTPGETIELEGYTRFGVYSIGEHRVLLDPADWYLYCKAIITVTGKHTFDLYTEEYMNPDDVAPMRFYYISGRISSGGQLSFPIPAIQDIVMHTGVTPHGRGVNQGNIIYKGSLNEGSLIAVAQVIGLQTHSATFPFYWKDPSDPSVLFDGPISFTLSFELSVVD